MQHVFTVFANSIIKKDVEDLKKTKNPDCLMDYHSTLISQAKGIDVEFWKNYNIIERTEEEAYYFKHLQQENSNRSK
ncbi:MAG: hypothetical protein ABJP45_17730 [Cyclobacteriaceae bacterium]